MSDPFLGEIKQVAYTFAPKDWSECNGNHLPISTHGALFSLLGVQFGGNGRTDFALPDFRGRMPRHPHAATLATIQGAIGGHENATLSASTMPSHTHDLNASTDPANSSLPVLTGSQENQFAEAGVGDPFYHTPTSLLSLNSASISSAGGGQSFSVIQPTAAVLFIIALDGVYPSRS